MINEEFLLQTFATRPQSLRIAMVTETYPPEINGVSMTIQRQVSDLQQRGHQIQLIRPQQSAVDKAISTLNFEEVLKRGISIPRYSGLKIGLPAKAALLRLWKTKRPDLVHIVTEGPLGWSALSAAHTLRLPVTTDFHTNFHSYTEHYGAAWLRKPILSYLRKFHNKACVTLVPTEGLKRELHACGYHNLEVVARGVDIGLFHPNKRDLALRASWGATDDTQVILYVGRLAPEKNLNMVFKTFAAMQTYNPNILLVLVGDGPDRQRLQAQHPAAVFCGMRTNEQLAQHYASGDVFLFPSLTETYGNVTVEAMASGLTVLAYRYAAAESLIKHDQNGLTATYNNEHEFIQLAVKLVTQSARIRAIGQQAHASARNFSWDRVHQQFERILQLTLDKEM